MLIHFYLLIRLPISIPSDTITTASTSAIFDAVPEYGWDGRQIPLLYIALIFSVQQSIFAAHAAHSACIVKTTSTRHSVCAGA